MARGVRAELDDRVGDFGNEPRAAVGRGRMHVDNGLAAVQLFEYRIEALVTQPFGAIAGVQPHAGCLQHIVAVFDFLQRGIGIVHRQCQEVPDAVAVVGSQPGSFLVDAARQRAATLPGRQSRGRDGDDRTCDAGSAHVVHVLLQAPCIHRTWRAKRAQHFGLEMRMHVDDGRLAPAFFRAQGDRGDRGQCRKPQQHLSPRRACELIHGACLLETLVDGSPASSSGTPRVSGRNSSAQTMLNSVNTRGYSRPALMSPRAATSAKALTGSRPPTQPTPMLYGTESAVYRTCVGKSSTSAAACGPYSVVEVSMSSTKIPRIAHGRAACLSAATG